MTATEINGKMESNLSPSHRLKELYVTPAADPGSLERALEIAAEAHAGQKLPTGEPYVLHPLRMVAKLHTPEAQIVAALHDVIEKNTRWDLERLAREGFTTTILEAVDALTKREDESFIGEVERAGQNRIARMVKRADITDHLKHFPRETNKPEYPYALLMLLAPPQGEGIGRMH
jgi:(p)ppGpp synthase/HD superfamily hydrolase